MATNELDIEDRVKIGKKREIEVLQILEGRKVQINREKLISWHLSDHEQDMKEKIDVWLQTINGQLYSGQIKFRDSGPDFGASLIMPYTTFEKFCEDFDAKTLPWDRDARGVVDYYICLSNRSTILMFIKKETVMAAAAKMLAKVRFDGFNGNSFVSPEIEGAELKIVKDAGSGYSQGQSKIIMYLTPDYIETAGDKVWRKS